MKPEITICMGSSCFARGNEKNLDIIEAYLNENNLQDEVDLVMSCSLCKGNCSKGPNLTVNGKEYNNVDSGVMYEILTKYLNTEA